MIAYVTTLYIVMFFFDESKPSGIRAKSPDPEFVVGRGRRRRPPAAPGRVLRQRRTLWACVWAPGIADAAPESRHCDNSVMRCHGKSMKTMDFH